MYSNVITISILGSEHLENAWNQNIYPRILVATLFVKPKSGNNKIQMFINMEKINILWYMDAM